jgi:hypothetical protein
VNGLCPGEVEGTIYQLLGLLARFVRACGDRDGRLAHPVAASLTAPSTNRFATLSRRHHRQPRIRRVA